MRLAHILGRRPTTASSRSDAKRGPDTEVLYFLERAKVFAVPPLLVQTISSGIKHVKKKSFCPPSDNKGRMRR